MAVEAQRACGYRRVGGLYLVGGGLGIPCDRLPLPIVPCETCGEEPRFHRGISRINPMRLWDTHFVESIPTAVACPDTARRIDPICDPPLAAYLMWVGSEYTPASFVAEARQLGVSKRIPSIPDGFTPGKWVFLAYLHLIPPPNAQLPLPPDSDYRGYKPGVFYAFQPQRVEKIITQSQADSGGAQKLKEQGIMPVVVPDDDPDHNPRRKSRVEGE